MNVISKALNDLPEVMQLTKADEVIKYVPSSAKYVTVATASSVSDVEGLKRSSHFSFNGITNFHGLGPQSTGYLYHDGVNLSLVTPTSTVFQIPLNQISGVEPLNGDFGNLIITSAAGVYLVGQFVAVQTTPTATYKTWSGISFGDYAWHKELASLGVITPTQQKSIKRNQLVFIIIWAVVLVLMLGLFFLKK